MYPRTHNQFEPCMAQSWGLWPPCSRLSSGNGAEVESLGPRTLPSGAAQHTLDGALSPWTTSHAVGRITMHAVSESAPLLPLRCPLVGKQPRTFEHLTSRSHHTCTGLALASGAFEASRGHSPGTTAVLRTPQPPSIPCSIALMSAFDALMPAAGGPVAGSHQSLERR